MPKKETDGDGEKLFLVFLIPSTSCILPGLSQIFEALGVFLCVGSLLVRSSLLCRQRINRRKSLLHGLGKKQKEIASSLRHFDSKSKAMYVWALSVQSKSLSAGAAIAHNQQPADNGDGQRGDLGGAV